MTLIQLSKKSSALSINLLNSPMFPIRSAKGVNNDLTYRKINDWQNKQLISSHRDNPKGWRMFSFVEMIRLLIVSDLKTFGISNSSIIKILNLIQNYNFGQEDVSTNNPHTFENLIEIYGVLGTRCVIAILSEDNVNFLFDETSSNKKIHFEEICQTPCIILPFSNYIEQVFRKINIKGTYADDPLLKNIIKFIDEEKENAIIDFIKNADYEEVVITKTDGKEIVYKLKTRQRGIFSDEEILNTIKEKNYQVVRLSRVNGQIITIVQEETIKI